MKYLVISIILLILSLLRATFPLTLVFEKLIGPAQKTTTYYAQDINNFFGIFGRNLNISKDYENLYLEYQSLQSENARLKYLRDENTQLRKQLNIVNSEDVLKNKKFVYTHVFANPSDKSGNTMLINAGTISGVHKGDVVIRDNNIVGIIKNATSGKSIVELITSPTLRIPVYNFSSEQKAEGIVTGKFGTSIVLENILPADKIKIGDILMTSTRIDTIPPNLVVGKVVRIEGGGSSTVQTAFIESLVDIKNLQRVYILVD